MKNVINMGDWIAHKQARVTTEYLKNSDKDYQIALAYGVCDRCGAVGGIRPLTTRFYDYVCLACAEELRR